MAPSKVLTREQVLAAVEKRRKATHPIKVPEWGGTICVKLLKPEDAERTGLAAGKEDAQMFARVIAAAACDKEGTPLFTEEDVLPLAEADMATAGRVYVEILRYNGLLDEAAEEAVSAFLNAQPGSSSTS